MEKIVEDQEAAQRLEKAWTCILTQYRNYILEKTGEKGKGIHIFRMMDNTDDEGHNCEYCFANEHMWDSFIDSVPNKKEFLNVYLPGSTKMYAVMVSVPIMISDIEEGTIQNIRLFNIDDNKEIDFSLFGKFSM